MRLFKLFLVIVAVYNVTIPLYCQSRTILVFDLEKGTKDSIVLDVSAIDTTKWSEFTPYYIGDFDSNVETLEQETPSGNLSHPNAKSTKRRKAHLDYDLNSFPIRTSVKISYIENNNMNNLCSGSFISKRHILTAAHCHMKKNEDSLLFDSLIVCPVFDNGTPNGNFGCSSVSKIYSFKNWSTDEDFVILELKQSIGQQTGWLGIGYESNYFDLVQNHLFYKFNYPARFIPTIDSIRYNGDTIYYRYGKAHAFKFSFGDSTYYKIGFLYNLPINGESGSSLISVKNDEFYVSYGVVSHFYSLITNEVFFIFKNIIKNDISNSLDLAEKYSFISVFPNPTTGILQISNLPQDKKVDILVSDMFGRVVFTNKNIIYGDGLNLAHLLHGQYFISLIIDNTILVRKFVKFD